MGAQPLVLSTLIYRSFIMNNIVLSTAITDTCYIYIRYDFKHTRSGYKIPRRYSDFFYYVHT